MKSFIANQNRKLSKLALNNIDDLSFSALNKAFRKRDVKVNGKRVSEDVTLNVGDKVEIYYTSVTVKKFSTIYHDDNILVVNKKSGYTSESLYEEIKSEFIAARFIHRLDRNTDGIMIFALNDVAEQELLFGFKNRTFDKKYLAQVKGVPKQKQGVLTAYLLKDSDAALVKIFDHQVPNSVQIKTGYKVVESKDNTSLLEVTLYTGKTHQIRAHLSHIGHPIIGDTKYGDFELNKKLNEKSQKLTAHSLTLCFNESSPLYYLNKKTFSI